MAIDSKSRILVVDDSGTVRGIVRKLLTELGFVDIDEAIDGKSALSKIKETPYGLVISDWNMAPMNGQALLEHVRSQKEFENLPFIMMTADSTPDKIVDAKYAGVSCFIIKPFGADALKAKISQIDTN